MSGYLTTKEAAQKIGLSQPRINQLIAEGKLRAEKHGTIYFIREDDLEPIINRRETRGRKRKSK